MNKSVFSHTIYFFLINIQQKQLFFPLVYNPVNSYTYVPPPQSGYRTGPSSQRVPCAMPCVK